MKGLLKPAQDLMKNNAAAVGLAAVVLLALVGWVAAGQIRSPAQIAADTAPPVAAPITVPVVQRELSSEVIVRGIVRYGAPRPVNIPTSKIRIGPDLITKAPQRRATLGRGSVAMNIDGRPVFVFRGVIPMHRDFRLGVKGPDVKQLERGLKELKINPGKIDGLYDSATAAAVSRLYIRRGREPFGASELQKAELRTAAQAAATSRDAHLQARNTLEIASRGGTPAEVSQARIDANNARDAVNTSLVALSTARSAVARTANTQKQAENQIKRDQALADADVATKRAAYQAAQEEERVARIRQSEVPSEARPSDREAAAIAVRNAQENVKRTKGDLDASMAAARLVRNGLPAARKQARIEADQARAELRRAQRGVGTARNHAKLTAARVVALTSSTATSAMPAIVDSTRREMLRTQKELERLSREAGIQVPASEVLFFPSLPVRVDTVKARRGAIATAGRVMDVTNSTLAVDSSLSVADRELVTPGNRVQIEEQDLGVNARGQVTRVADTPGTNKVDPNRYYFEITPDPKTPLKLVGNSVKLTIAVKSTSGAVLAVPVSAVSLGGDGLSRVRVRSQGRTRLVTVVPGLAAGGLVEVRAVETDQLHRGDLVIVGRKPTGRAPGTEAGKVS